MLLIRRGLAAQGLPVLASSHAGLRAFAAGGAAVVDIKTDAEFASTMGSLDAQQLAIVDFTAVWCGPCKFIAPHYEALSKQHPQIKFLKVDIDKADLRGTVASHNITGVPTFTVYKGANKVENFTGARLDYLKEVIAKHSGAKK